MLAIVDYGAGNLFSVSNALDYLGVPHVITDQPEQVAAADGIILPGVGAFPDAMGMLTARGFVPLLRQQAVEKPLLGICLGMQMLFEVGYEFGETAGLGLIPGCVQLLDGGGLKVPHMGWNDLTILHESPLTKGLHNGDYVYFVHSYRAETPEEYISCYSMYHKQIPALVQRGHVYGAQFHPEKSGTVGMTILQNFAKLVSK